MVIQSWRVDRVDEVVPACVDLHTQFDVGIDVGRVAFDFGQNDQGHPVVVSSD